MQNQIGGRRSPHCKALGKRPTPRQGGGGQVEHPPGSSRLPTRLNIRSSYEPLMLRFVGLDPARRAYNGLTDAALTAEDTAKMWKRFLTHA